MSMPFASMLSRLLAAPLARVVLDAVESIRERRLDEAEAVVEMERVIAAAIERVAAAELAARRDVLLVELGGESRLQRHWRPIVALAGFFSYWYVIIIIPHLVGFGLMPPMQFGERGLENLFWIVIVSVGGYIGGRSLEKVARVLRSG